MNDFKKIFCNHKWKIAEAQLLDRNNKQLGNNMLIGTCNKCKSIKKVDLGFKLISRGKITNE